MFPLFANKSSQLCLENLICTVWQIAIKVLGRGFASPAQSFILPPPPTEGTRSRRITSLIMGVFWGFLLERQQGRGEIRSFRLSNHLSKEKEAIPIPKKKIAAQRLKKTTKQINRAANHDISQGLQEIKTIHSHAEKARKKPSTEALQTDRHREKEYSLPLTCPLCRWVCADSELREALGRERSFVRASPLLGVTVTPRHPSPPQISPGSSSSSEPLSHQPQPGCAARALCSGSRRIPAHPSASQSIPASPTWQQKPSLSPRGHWGRMPKAAGEHRGAGRGGCLRKRSLCWDKEPARLALSGSPEL